MKMMMKRMMKTQNCHNSANFEAKTSRFCMVIDLNDTYRMMIMMVIIMTMTIVMMNTQNGHNSANFDSTTSIFCMVKGLIHLWSCLCFHKLAWINLSPFSIVGLSSVGISWRHAFLYEPPPTFPLAENSSIEKGDKLIQASLWKQRQLHRCIKPFTMQNMEVVESKLAELWPFCVFIITIVIVIIITIIIIIL
jgi:hypothetical protein